MGTLSSCKYLMHTMIFGMLQADTWARSYLVFIVLSLRDSFIPSLSLPRCCFPNLGSTWLRRRERGRRRSIPWHSVSRLGRFGFFKKYSKNMCIFTPPPFSTLSELDLSKYVTSAYPEAMISRTTGCSNEANEVKMDKRE